MKKRFIAFCLIVISLSISSAQTRKITISGFVHDKETGETLIGAGIAADGTNGTVTNNFGFYSLTLGAGEHIVSCSYIGYATLEIRMNIQKDTTLKFILEPAATLSEAVVTAHKDAGIHSIYPGSVEIPLEQIKSTPVIFGEADVMKTIQLLPGVQSGMEGTSGIYVRGGGPDENLMLLDGVPIYNVDHMLGLFSAFTPEAVKKVTFYKGAFPASYSGRISSVVDVRTNDGNMKRHKGSVGVSLLNSKLHLEGPIFKDKTSYSFSSRGLHTLLADPIFKIFGLTSNYFFYDINGKITHRFSDTDRISASIYNGMDLLKLDVQEEDDKDSGIKLGESSSNSKSKVRWGNLVTAVRWNHVFNGKLFSNSTLSFNKYKMNIIMEAKEKYKEDGVASETLINAHHNSGIRDLGARTDFDYKPDGRQQIRFGGEYLFHTFLPETRSFRQKESEDGKQVTDTLFLNSKNRTIRGHEISLYAEDNILIFSWLTLNPGIHLSIFNTDGKTYFTPEPRISTRIDFGKGFSAKASYSGISQYIHLLTSSKITLPTDLWVPITKDIKPVYSDQYSLGTYYSGLGGWEFSIEAYFKSMKNILEYKEGTTVMGSSAGWEEKVEMGTGKAYGMEILIQKTSGSTTGWLGYTLAKSTRLFESINNGRPFPYKYDRRHNISICVNHKFNDRIDIGGTWTFATGGTITVPVRQSDAATPEGEPYNYSYVGGRNNYRIPPSHHLNLGVNFRKHKKHGERVWNISVYNVYNAMNPNLVFVESEFGMDRDLPYNNTKLKKVTLLPIIPSFGYTYNF